MLIVAIRIDLAKNLFSVHCVPTTDQVALERPKIWSTAPSELAS